MFASGTNIQRLSRCTRAVEGVLCATYSELEQNEVEGIVRRKFIATSISSELKAQIDKFDPKNQPSFSKIWDRPLPNKAFIAQMAQDLTGYNSLNPRLNLSSLADTTISCIQLWTSCDIDPMKHVERIIKDAIPKWLVCKINGSETTGADAEAFTRKKIEEAKELKLDGVLIISSIMTARSFSIPEIQATVLAFDRGSADSAAQKASRCLTPGNTYHYLDKMQSPKSEGLIVDLGMDPNRFENIEAIVLEESLANQVAGNADNFHDAVKYTLASMNLFTVNEYGYLEEITETDMFRIFNDTENLLKIADVDIDISAISDLEIVKILKNIKGGDPALQKVKDIIAKDVVNSVIKGIKKPKDVREIDKETKSLKALLKTAIKALNMSATSVFNLADVFELKSYRECLAVIQKDKAKANEFKELFGISANDMLTLLKSGLLQEAILDLVVLAGKPESETSMNLFL
jgi:hypothetical protein